VCSRLAFGGDSPIFPRQLLFPPTVKRQRCSSSVAPCSACWGRDKATGNMAASEGGSWWALEHDTLSKEPLAEPQPVGIPS